MKPRITLITVGVDDLERSVRFYRDGLGWETKGIVGKEFEHGAVAFFDLDFGLRLALWPRKSLSHDSGLAGETQPDGVLPRLRGILPRSRSAPLGSGVEPQHDSAGVKRLRAWRDDCERLF